MSLTLPQTGAASPESIARLVERFGELPPSYREFLDTHNGVVPQENVLRGTSNRIGVRSFLAADDVAMTSQSVDGLSAELIPIADDESGNYVCIGSKDHRIYFWDHEIDRDEVIADKFDEFLERLDPFDISQVRLQPGQVKRVWVNPDFKPEF